MLASLCGHLEVVKHLQENGAEIDAKSNDGWTSLMLASQNGHLEVVKYLQVLKAAFFYNLLGIGWASFVLAWIINICLYAIHPSKGI